MRDGWVYELVDRCGWGRGALGYVICNLHMWVGVDVSVSTGRTGLVEGTANTCLYSAPGEESRQEVQGATLVCVVQHSRNSL